MNNHKDSSISEHAWNYFEFHGRQRIILFRYYLLFYTLYITGMAFACVRFYMQGTSAETLTIITSLVFIIITFVFQGIDKRNMELIALSQIAMIELEKCFNKDSYQLFSSEKKSRTFWGHTEYFKVIYFTAYGSSLFFFIWALISICHNLSNLRSMC